MYGGVARFFCTEIFFDAMRLTPESGETVSQFLLRCTPTKCTQAGVYWIQIPGVVPSTYQTIFAKEIG